jgi:hypothetical protein
VKDEAAGRKVRCPNCGAILAVPRPPGEKGAEDEILDTLLTESPADAPPSPRPPKAAAEHVQEPPRRPVPPPGPSQPSWARKAGGERSKPRAKVRKKQREESWSGIAVHPAILTGLAMMAAGALWFFVRLANGWISPYPAVLFFLGIGSVIRGFTGQE